MYQGETRTKIIESIVESIKSGSTEKNACYAAGITRSTWYGWKKEDYLLNMAVERAKGSRVEIVEDRLYHEAEQGNVTAMIFFLCNRARDKWQRGDSAKILNVINNSNMKPSELIEGLNSEQRAKLESVLREANLLPEPDGRSSGEDKVRPDISP